MDETNNAAGTVMSQEIRRLPTVLPELIGAMKQLKIRREIFLKATKARFNVFTILRNAHEEVGLHSRFLSFLLDANGSHDCGDLFLMLFINTMEDGVINDAGEICKIPLLHEAKMGKFIRTEREKPCDCGLIDIFVEFANIVLVIENKIYANEQSEQIFRYSNYLRKSQKPGYVLYLTRHGQRSATASVHRDKYYRISYAHHILKWLKSCMEETLAYPNINNALQQYSEVVAGLTGKDKLAETNMNELRLLIDKYPEIMEYADEISACVTQIKQGHVERLWSLLKKELENRGMTLSDEEPFKWESTIFKPFYLDLKDLLIDSQQFPFCVELAGIEHIYCGIAMHRFDMKARRGRYSQHGDKFRTIASAIDGKLQNTSPEGSPTWPVGSMNLLNIDAEWHLKMNKNESGFIQQEAIRIADQATVYIGLLLGEWDKTFNKGSQ